MQCLDEELSPVKCLELNGLYNQAIIENIGLQNEDNWLKLINLYEGNPYYLKDIALLIKDMFDGNIAEFLEENNLVITNKIRLNLTELFNPLSPVEKQIVLGLSKLDQPISRQEFKENLGISSTSFINGLQSLQQRYLVTKIKEEKISFTLPPVFKEYVINFCW